MNCIQYESKVQPSIARSSKRPVRFRSLLSIQRTPAEKCHQTNRPECSAMTRDSISHTESDLPTHHFRFLSPTTPQLRIPFRAQYCCHVVPLKLCRSPWSRLADVLLPPRVSSPAYSRLDERLARPASRIRCNCALRLTPPPHPASQNENEEDLPMLMGAQLRN